MLKKFASFDYILALIPIILSALSVAVIYSLVFSSADTVLALKQGIFAAIGIVAMISIFFINYKNLRSAWWFIYIIAVILLIVVEIFGFAAGGAVRWIDLGFFQLQPSEIAKVAVVIALASILSKKTGRLSIKEYIWSVIIVTIPTILILLEPDLGTALVIVFISFVQVLFARPNRKQVLIIFAVIFLILLVFLLSFYKIAPFSNLMHDYQRNRVHTFIDPNLDPYGTGYNVRQAQITIGSGGVFGAGLGRGSQSQLKFLPKPHTDFIFAGSAEAMGFVGASFIVLLYFYLIFRIYYQSAKCSDSFGMLIGVGIGSIILFQTVVNIGMNLGIMPVTGIPLPFLSSGGTSLLIMFAAIGIVLSLGQRKTR